jgi:hypothetical protein
VLWIWTVSTVVEFAESERTLELTVLVVAAFVMVSGTDADWLALKLLSPE